MKKIQLLFAAVLFMAAMALTSCGNSKKCDKKCDKDKTECEDKKCDDDCEKPCCKEGEGDATDAIDGAVDNAGDAIDNATDGVKDAVDNATDGVKDAAKDAVNKIVE